MANDNGEGGGGGGPREKFFLLVTAKSEEFLTQVLGSEAGKSAAGRLALALRQAAAASPAIYECSPASVSEAVALSALTGLMPGGPLPLVYCLPRRIKGVMTLCWQVSFRGYLELARRSGYSLRAEAVYEGDTFLLRRGLHPDIQHEPATTDLPRTWDKLRGVYVVASRIQDGLVMDFIYLTRARIEQRRDCSESWRRSGQDSLWGYWPEEMACKTAIRYAVARGIVPLDEVGLRAYEADGLADAPPQEEQRTVTQVPVREPGRSARLLGEALGEVPMEPESPQEKLPALDVEGVLGQFDHMGLVSAYRAATGKMPDRDLDDRAMAEVIAEWRVENP